MISKEDVLEFQAGLTGLLSYPKELDQRMTCAVSKNIRKIRGECEDIQETVNKTLKSYNKERTALIDHHALRDKDGKQITEVRRNMIQTKLKDPIAFQEAEEILNKKWKETLEKNKEFLKSECNVKIHQVDDFPNLPAGLANTLFIMRKEKKDGGKCSDSKK